MSFLLEDKKTIVVNVIRLLSQEIEYGEINEMQNQLLQLARDSLDAAYDITPEDYKNQPTINLLEYIKQVEAELVNQGGPNQAKKFNKIGMFAMKMNDLQQAIHKFTLAIQCDPTTPVYLCNRAEAYHNLGYFDNAKVDCKHALMLDPKYARAFNRMGLVNISSRNLVEALKCLEYAVDYEPENIMYKKNMRFAVENFLSALRLNRYVSLNNDDVDNILPVSFDEEDNKDLNPLGPRFYNF